MKHIMLFEQWLATQGQPLLLEGGAYGHLSHPFEDLSLTIQDVKDMIDSTVKGAFGPENFVQEKVDGQNLMISWKDGRLIAARNKQHLKNAGENALTQQGVADLFAGRGDIETAYNAAMTDLSASIGSLSERDKLAMFDNGRKFASVEVITPVTQNTIPYGQSILVFHGVVEYDETGSPIGEDKQAAREIGKMVSNANAAAQKTFYVRGPVDISVMPFPDTKKREAYYNSKLKQIMKESGTTLNSTIGDYVLGSAINIIEREAKQAGVTLSPASVEGLAMRIGGINKSYSVPNIKKDLGADAQWFIDLEKNREKELKREVYAPLEGLFLEVGTEMMRNISAFLAANPTSAAEEMKREIESAIKTIRTNGDQIDVQKLEAEMLRVASAGGLESIVPTEGITFIYKGKPYKYTGIFAPLHQIRSILAYKN
jgi:hypothetical protein